jgi:ribosomal protein L40E
LICTKCGHDNPTSAKFCNECGSLVDRRKGERRQGDRRKAARAAPSPSLSPGQENAQGHSPAVLAAESYLRREPPRGPQQVPVEDTRVSGAPMHAAPSSSVTGFLGLSGGDGGSAEYLLEDEPNTGWRKWAVLLVLVVIGVLFYLQWRTSWHAQPAPAAPVMSTPPPETAPQGKAAPASEGSGVPAADPQQASKPADSPAAQPSAGKDAAAAAPAPEKPAADHSDSTAASAKDKPADKKPDAVTKDSSGDDPSTEDQPEESARPRHEHRISGHPQPIAERSPDRASAQDDPMVFMAQKYIYGEGVPRNCDQAMVYLRAANQKASVPARSQMGALYATGQCVPLNRVLAYQWFTSALNLDPGNSALQRERNNLWAQMSSSERQQAVR